VKHERRPWLAVVPWSQVLGLDGYAWTVLPHWPPYQKRIVRRGRDVTLFTPAVMDETTVLVPDEADALATLAATFGRPEVIAWRPDERTWWTVVQPVDSTVYAHLRDWHGTLESGSPSYRGTFPGGTPEALAYHWQLHQQQLVFPLPNDPHTH
jgi:hypothetical protein